MMRREQDIAYEESLKQDRIKEEEKRKKQEEEIIAKKLQEEKALHEAQLKEVNIVSCTVEILISLSKFYLFVTFSPLSRPNGCLWLISSPMSLGPTVRSLFQI